MIGTFVPIWTRTKVLSSLGPKYPEISRGLCERFTLNGVSEGLDWSLGFRLRFPADADLPIGGLPSRSMPKRFYGANPATSGQNSAVKRANRSIFGTKTHLQQPEAVFVSLEKVLVI